MRTREAIQADIAAIEKPLQALKNELAEYDVKEVYAKELERLAGELRVGKAKITNIDGGYVRADRRYSVTVKGLSMTDGVVFTLDGLR